MSTLSFILPRQWSNVFINRRGTQHSVIELKEGKCISSLLKSTWQEFSYKGQESVREGVPEWMEKTDGQTEGQTGLNGERGRGRCGWRADRRCCLGGWGMVAGVLLASGCGKWAPVKTGQLLRWRVGVGRNLCRRVRVSAVFSARLCVHITAPSLSGDAPRLCRCPRTESTWRFAKLILPVPPARYIPKWALRLVPPHERCQD